MQCLDGLQRFTALADYAADKVKVLGGKVSSDFRGTSFDSRRFRAQVRVYGLVNRADLLRFYLDLNTGGTVHTTQELDRVRSLLDAAPKASIAPTPRARKPGR